MNCKTEVKAFGNLILFFCMIQCMSTKIKIIITNYENEFKDMSDKCLAWEKTKMKIRSFSVPYCVKKK